MRTKHRLSAGDRQTWRGWHHCKRDGTLCYGHGKGVDIRRCKDAASILTTIFYIQQKQWCTDDCLVGLIAALGDLFGTMWVPS